MEQPSREWSPLATQRSYGNQSNPALKGRQSEALHLKGHLKNLMKQRDGVDKQRDDLDKEIQSIMQKLEGQDSTSPQSAPPLSHSHSSTAAAAAAPWEGSFGNSSSSQNGTDKVDSSVDIRRSPSPDAASNGRPVGSSFSNGRQQRFNHNMPPYPSHPPAPEQHHQGTFNLCYAPPKPSEQEQQQPSQQEDHHQQLHPWHYPPPPLPPPPQQQQQQQQQTHSTLPQTPLQQVQQQQHQHQPQHGAAAPASATTAAAAADAARKEEVLLQEVPHDICMVQDGATARKVVDYLIRKSKEAFTYREGSRIFQPKVKRDTRRYFACDTEVAYIDIKSESPVGHGCVNCFSIYCGDDIDFREALIDDSSTPSAVGAPDSPTAEHTSSSSTPATTSVNASSNASDSQQLLTAEHAGPSSYPTSTNGCTSSSASDPPQLSTGSLPPCVSSSSSLPVSSSRPSTEIPHSSAGKGSEEAPPFCPSRDDPSVLSASNPTSAHCPSALGEGADATYAGAGGGSSSSPASSLSGDQTSSNGPASTSPRDQANSSSRTSQSSTPQRRLWVDVWPEVEKDEQGKPLWKDAKVVLKPEHPIIAEFKRFFEDDSIAKVWHNYGFDRHVMANLGIECQGFMGDTLHMARLADASRSGKKNYSLESLTSDHDIMKELGEVDRVGRGRTIRRKVAALKPKKSMKERFGQKRIMKDGKTEGKLLEVPPIHVLHEDPKFRPTWVEYSARDAETTWLLREALYRKLKQSEWRRDTHLIKKLQHKPQTLGLDPENTLYEFYQQYWIPFGRILTDMEKYGMMVNREHLRKAQVQAQKDRDANLQTFMAWAKSKVPDAEFMNAGSGSQIRQLLFPEYPGTTAGKPKAPSPSAGATPSRSTTPGPGGEEGAGQKRAVSPKPKAAQLPGCRTFRVPRPQHLIDADVAQGVKRPKKHMDITLHSIWGPGKDKGQLTPEVMTATGAAAVSIMVLKSLSGKAGAARKALEALVEEEERAEKEMLEKISAAVADEMKADEMRAKLEEKKRQNLPLERAPMPLEDELDSAEAKLFGATGDVDEMGNRSYSPEVDEDLPSDLEDEEQLEKGPGAHQAEQQAPGPSNADQQLMRAELESEAKAKGYGKLYAAMGGGKEGLEACVAIEALCEVSAIDKLLTAFIIPLQGDNISTPYGNGHRIHCSLNINTETGRLSARRPNLQNQPALEKDRYKVRQAFTAFNAGEENGNTLVVADYGQLELRILAHVADCKSMLEAFILGGDFHSRTAYGMYDDIQADIAAGNSYLEWEGEGVPDKPLLKDKFASERRKAKILNFSIAYGKTAFGLAKDFGTSLEEAQQTVDRWYADRKEVLKWQVETTNRAKIEKPVPFVSTLLGRTRPLPDLNSKDRRKAGHAQRASINTPIQGSAADVASSAMLAIDHCKDLEKMGWRLVMQVHDEVILEGPKETAQQAKDLVVKHMAHPWAWAAKDPSLQEGVQPLRVELAVDANTADTWYEAK